MAVRTQIITCQVCSTKTLLKFQVGILNQYPIHFSCPLCLTNIYGDIFLNQLEGSLEFKLTNAINENEGKEEYILVVSGEFPSIKVVKSTEDSFKAALFSPFIRYSPHSKEEIRKYQILFNIFPKFIDNEWKYIERIASLYFNGKDEYIESEVNKLRKSSLLTISPFEKDSSVSKLITTVFRELSSKKPFWESSTTYLSERLHVISEKNPNNYMELLNYYTLEDLLNIQKKLFSLFNEFINHFRYIVPVIYLEAIDRNIEDIKHDEGINTVSIEKLERYYQNSFETLLENSTLAMMIDNLIVRGSINSMSSNINIRKKPVNKIADFQKLTKGQKLCYLSESKNIISPIYQIALDSKLRNPIGHNNYSYDPNSQLIKFHTNSKLQEKELYLIEFAYKCFQTMKINLTIWDLTITIKNLIKEKNSHFASN